MMVMVFGGIRFNTKQMPFGKKPDTSKKVAFLDSLTNSRVHHTFLARVVRGIDGFLSRLPHEPSARGLLVGQQARKARGPCVSGKTCSGTEGPRN